MKYLYLLCALTIAISAQGKEAYIENKGQIIDQNRAPNPSVLYLYNGNGLNVQLRKTGFSYDVWKSNADSTTTYNRIDIDFVNTSAAMRTTASGQSNDYLNYYTEYTGTNGVTHVHNYSEVVYLNVWNGIDLQFVLNGDKPKYNFIIHAGAKLSDIKLDIKGANKIAAVNNSLLLETNLSVVEESVPNSYYSINEQKSTVHAGFVKNNDGTYGLKVVENIPVNAELVIDPFPQIQWGTFYGGSGGDKALGSAADKFGNVYIGGITQSGGTMASSGAYQQNIASMEDGFIAKFNASGARLWSTYYGGTARDEVDDIAMDTSGKNIYICGQTISASVFATAGAAQASPGGSYDAILAMFDSAGVRQWGTYLGGSAVEAAYFVAVDSINNLYVGGYTYSTDFPTSGNAHQSASGGLIDCYVAKYSPSGTKIFATFYGGNSDDYIGRILVRGNALYVAGKTYSTNNMTTTGAYKSSVTASAYSEAFLTKFDLAGNRQWGTFFGGSMDDGINALAADASGIYFGGNTYSNSGITTPGAYQTAFGGGNSDAYLAKLDNTGTNLLWATYYGGTGDESMYDIAKDKTGNLVTMGATTSSGGIATAGTLHPVYNVSYNSFISKFTTAGSLAWGSYYDYVTPYELSVDPQNNIFLCGTVTTGAISTAGAYQPAHGGGGTDAFLVKFGVCDTGFGTATVNVVFVGGTLQFNATGGATYLWTGPNGFTSSSANPTIPNAQISHNGIYTVTITDAGGCQSVKTVQVTVNVGVHDIASIGSFSLYPNPNTGLAQIDIDLKQQQKLFVNITDITGRTIYTVNAKTYPSGRTKIELEMHLLPAGTYICRLQNEYGNTVSSSKMVKE
jgi:hypothetical protein